ncbi:MAG: hypothetical protein IIV23_09800, partial [Ruminococcus sp.]|nr:hypothetical protein [Ruminococcus sp.]
AVLTKETGTCAACKRRFSTLTLMQCRYTKKPKNVCFWCCKSKCPHAKELDGKIRCTYKEDKT